MSITNETRPPYDNFNELQNASQLEDRLIYESLITLMDQIFGQHDHMIINMESETELNHEIIRDNWGLLTKFFKIPDRLKNTKKCVRQTCLYLTNHLNERYGFVNPIKFDHKRHGYRRDNGKLSSEYWYDFSFV